MANFFSQLIGKGRGDSGRTQRYMQSAYENLGSSGQIGYRGDGVYDYSQALNGVQFDQFGFTNQLPADLIAPEVQLRANQIAAQRNDPCSPRARRTRSWLCGAGSAISRATGQAGQPRFSRPTTSRWPAPTSRVPWRGSRRPLT